MRRLFLYLLLTLNLSSFAQDTIWVQTFTYDTISTRRAIFPFPPSLNGESFEKVLMYYNIKCDPLTPWDSYNCGEWDYLAYAQIFDHTGIFDSNAVTHPHYLVNNQNVSPVEYVNSPYYHYYGNYQYFPNYTTSTDLDFTVGTGSSNTAQPFATTNETQHTQLLWTATELSGAGITSGDIAKLRFDVVTLGDDMGHLTIRMKHTSATDLTGFDNSGWTLVYDQNTSFSSTGLNTVDLAWPFNYDGVSGILVDISWENNSSGSSDHSLTASNTVNNSVVYTNDRKGYLHVEQGEYATVELSDYDFQNEITISFWAKGDGTVLPSNSSILEGRDTSNNRVINIHFPWSDGVHYWDCGEGSNYDRINLAASTGEIADEWHHWAFTKNAVTGVMNIYKDGVLWHTGSGLTRPVGVVNKFYLGKSIGGNYQWAGLIDEFRIWDVELSGTEIANWMNQSVNATHPNYADLVVYYDFDNENSIQDKSGNGRDAMQSGDMIEFYGDIQAGYTLDNVRPDVTFVQGTHIFTLDSTLVTDSVQVASQGVTEYQLSNENFYLLDIQHFYPAGYSFTYDSNGNKTDSTFHGADVSFANDTLIYYEDPYEIEDRYEIGRFITPYGIGFDLGPNGFTYVYDVTDYQSLLQGDVDFQAHNTQELIDVRFAFVLGTPPRDVIKMERLWGGRGSYTYSNLDNDVNLSATDVDLDPSGAMFKLRTRITGHGHYGSVNCCEWGNGQGRDHEILIDGTPRLNWEIWQETECGDNPNTGQGGTWPYAREGWCPGDKVTDYEFDITPYVTAGTTASIDYDIEDVPAWDLAQGGGNYVIAVHMVTYGAPNFTVDGAIVDVLNPNGWEYYSKWNPTCQNPRIIIQNTGSETMTSAVINVWIGGFDNVLSFNWTGSLEFLEQEIVEIPVTSDWWYDFEGSNTFTARLYSVNGQTDEYQPNNRMTVEFEAAPSAPADVFIWLKTNNKANENQLYLKDDQGNIIFQRTTLVNNTDYKDTLHLDPGCYTLELYDSDHDGLGYWYSNTPVSLGGEGETNGTFQLRKAAGGLINNFDRDFGHYTSYSFSVGYEVGLEENNSSSFMQIYPNPSEGMFNLVLDNFPGDAVQIEIYNEMGQLVHAEQLQGEATGYFEQQLDLTSLESGLYLIRVVSDEQTSSQRLILH